MSASHRSLVRLPLSIFENLCDRDEKGTDAGENSPKSNNGDDARLTAATNAETVVKRTTSGDADTEAIRLRAAICLKLKQYKKTQGGTFRKNQQNQKEDGVKTVGALLLMSRMTLLQVLDPLLTYGTSLNRNICVLFFYL